MSQVSGNPLCASPCCVSSLRPGDGAVQNSFDWVVLFFVGHLLCLCLETRHGLVSRVFQLANSGIILHIVCLFFLKWIFQLWDSFKSMGIIVVHSFLCCLIPFHQLYNTYFSPQMSLSAVGLWFAIPTTSQLLSVWQGQAIAVTACPSSSHRCDFGYVVTSEPWCIIDLTWVEFNWPLKGLQTYYSETWPWDKKKKTPYAYCLHRQAWAQSSVIYDQVCLNQSERDRKITLNLKSWL